MDLFLDSSNTLDTSFDDMKIGIKLLNFGIITRVQLEEALKLQLNTSKRIGSCMFELGGTFHSKSWIFSSIFNFLICDDVLFVVLLL